MLQVAQSAELSLKKYAFARGRGSHEEAAGLAYEGTERFAVALEPGGDLLERVALGPVDLCEDEVFPLQYLGEALRHLPGIAEVAGLDGLFLILVGIEGRYALLGGAELVRAEALLLEAVLFLVPGQEQAGPLAYHEILGGYLHALGADRLDLLPEALEIERHAGAENIHDPGAEDARRQQVQGELAVFVYNGVPRVPAALVADDDVKVPGEQVHHAALALVAPVDSNYRAV